MNRPQLDRGNYLSARGRRYRARSSSLDERPRQRLDQIFGDHSRAAASRRFGMQPDGRGGGFEDRHPLGQQTERDARQDVAGAGGGQAGWRVGLNDRSSVRGRDDRIGALQKHDGATARGGVARPRQLVALHVEQTPELPFVRRQQTGAVDRGEQSARLIGEAGQGVGIQNAGLAAPSAARTR